MSVPISWHFHWLLLTDNVEYSAYQSVAMGILSPYNVRYNDTLEALDKRYRNALEGASDKLKFHLNNWVKFYRKDIEKAVEKRRIEEEIKNERKKLGRS